MSKEDKKFHTDYEHEHNCNDEQFNDLNNEESLDINQKIKQAQDMNQVADDRLLRLAAELQNTRNRFAKDIENARFNALRDFALDMCEIADNMERAKQFIKPDNDNNNVIQGIDMILNSLSSILKRHGIEAIKSLNEKFNPSLHEAISEEITTRIPSGHVFREVQSGYTLNGKLLRPARVIVSKN